MKKNRLIALALAAVLALTLTACGGEKGSDLDYIKEKGTLVVGITEFKPMDYKDDSGQWIGFDADLAKQVARDLGVTAEFVIIDWDSKVMELENKSIDCVWNGMTLTDAVVKAMETTKPYCNNAQVVVVPAGEAGQYQTEESLGSLKFAVETESAGEGAVKEREYSYTAVQDQATALMEVASGASDACVIDLLMAGAMIGPGTSYPDLAHTVALTSEEYGIGFRKGSDMAAKVNELLAGYAADGSLLALAETYGVQDAVILE